MQKLLEWLKARKHQVAMVAAIGALLLGTTCVSCKQTGIPDPIVRGIGFDVVSALQTAYDNSEDPEVVGQFVALAADRATGYEKADLTDLDREKVKRLKEGLAKIFERRAEESYVILRCRSLIILTRSIGFYGTEGLEQFLSYLKENAP